MLVLVCIHVWMYVRLKLNKICLNQGKCIMHYRKIKKCTTKTRTDIVHNVIVWFYSVGMGLKFRWNVKQCRSWPGAVWSGSDLFVQAYLSQYLDFYSMSDKTLKLCICVISNICIMAYIFSFDVWCAIFELTPGTAILSRRLSFQIPIQLHWAFIRSVL